MHLGTGYSAFSEAQGSDSLKLELGEVVSHVTWVLRTELSPLEERKALLTSEPSSPGPRLETLHCMSFLSLCTCGSMHARMCYSVYMEVREVTSSVT